MAFNGRFVLNIAHFAASQGADMKSLIKLSGQSAEELCKEDSSIENTVYNSIMERAIELTGDDFFGLHVGESLNLTALGLIGQITQTSKTVKQALEFCCQFANLGCSALPLKLVEEKQNYKLTLNPDTLWKTQSQIALRHTAEGVISFTLREFHGLTRMKHAPIKIHLSTPKPSSISEYQRVYNCPVIFNQKEMAIFFKKEHIEEEVITANYEVLRILVQYAEEKSSMLNQKQGFENLVKKSIIKLLKPEFPTIEQVAGHLNISLRTLQRRLKTEGVIYKQLINELRKEFAINYLKRPELSIAEIAYLLNYANVSTFSRSFKKWLGVSPTQYRSSNSQ
jgi:AraC-like DNA-binding protein